MNQESPKHSDFHIASVIVLTPPHAFGRRVRSQFGKSSDERLALGSTRRTEEVESLLIKHKLPIRHLVPFGQEPLVGVE